MKTKIIALCAAAFLVASCSIKEDRSACPGWLHLALSGRSVSIAGAFEARVSVNSCGRTYTLSLSADHPETWIQVGRGAVKMEAVLGNGAERGQAWGGECDSLWADSSNFRVREDECFAEVQLHKRFATVWFSFDAEPDPDAGSLVVRSSDGFRCLLPLSGKEPSVRLPEDAGDSALELVCLDSDGGAALWNWDLGYALLAAGYDWGAKDLADARVRVSLAPLSIAVDVLPWDGGGSIHLEI